MAERMNKAGLSYVDFSSDLANAFGSVSHQATDEHQASLLRPLDVAFFSKNGTGGSS